MTMTVNLVGCHCYRYCHSIFILYFMSTFFAWVRAHRRDLFLWTAFFLLLVLSFGVGYFLGRDINPAPIVIEKCSGQ